MTKAQEIAILDRAIAQLGPQSYLGPWLTESRLSIVADITNDVCIEVPLPGAARRDGAAILEAARTQAAAIVEAAERKAAQIEDQALAERRRVRESAARCLRTALMEVER